MHTNKSSKISVYLEGGIGDCILGSRFISAIIDKYPNCEITAYFDTEGNPIQKQIINYLYPGFYKDIITIPRKKYKEMWIDSQFGTERAMGFIENVPDEIREEMIKNYDLFFDLHVDSLNFLDYDINWHKYFYEIMRPTVKPINKWGDFVCLHLVSGSSLTHRLQDWYIHRLIKDLAAKINYDIYLISTPETNHFYEKSLSEKVKIFNGNVTDVCDLVLSSKGIIGVDSAWRLLGHSQNKPTITLSKDCYGYGNCPVSHKLRWLMFPSSTFPLHFATQGIVNLFEKMLNPATQNLYMTFPELCFLDGDLNNIIIRRKYKINEQKTILG